VRWLNRMRIHSTSIPAESVSSESRPADI
jgi:hypothetical protein